MSNEKGIFEPKEGFASGPAPKSPFAADESPENPFASGPAEKSPFASGSEESSKPPEPPSSPFGGGESKSPFGMESPSPFGGAPASKPTAESDSPFAVEPEAKKESAGPPPFSEPPARPAEAAPAASTPAPAPEPVPASASPEPVAVLQPGDSGSSFGSESGSIRQLELRAIFGVDRELSESEIMQRAKSLPGIRNLAKVAPGDVGAIDGIKRVIDGLGFGGGQVKLFCGNAPLEFIREGQVLLAVQNDGSFAPGVRETLMIVARELGRL